MSEHAKAVDPGAWAAVTVEEGIRELEYSPKRIRRKVCGIFRTPGKDAGV